MGTGVKCRDCHQAFVGDSDEDRQMKKQGYKSCRAARNEVERATYVRGDTECKWPERVKSK